jgi:hypothetical protein
VQLLDVDQRNIDASITKDLRTRRKSASLITLQPFSEQFIIVRERSQDGSRNFGLFVFDLIKDQRSLSSSIGMTNNFGTVLEGNPQSRFEDANMALGPVSGEIVTHLMTAKVDAFAKTRIG